MGDNWANQTLSIFTQFIVDATLKTIGMAAKISLAKAGDFTLGEVDGMRKIEGHIRILVSLIGIWSKDGAAQRNFIT